MPRDQDSPIRFVPLRTATTPQRVAAFLLGPFLWLGGLVGVDLVARGGDDIPLALLIAGISFGLALLLIIPGRIRRNRREAPR